MSDVPPAPTFEPNAIVAGKLRLRRKLATGGMGEVWVARNESTGADVAIKVLRRGAGPTSEAEAAERFRNEARLSATLSHRGIVKVFDLIEDPWGSVLVMELLRGETLRAYLERTGPMPARQATAILGPILGALAHAHERGIVHRDVTPSNVFLAVDPDGHVTPKLLDFGIAKLAQGAAAPEAVQPVVTVDGNVLGTPRYMAPERIRGEADVDGRADIFSVGVVLYEALSGICPFASVTPAASLAAVLEQTVDTDPRIDARLWMELRRALAKRPYERHPTAKAFADALRASLGEAEAISTAELRITEPAQGWDTAPHAAAVESGADRGATAGHGVVVQARKRPSSAAWIGAGLLVGSVLGVAAFGWKTLAAGAPQGTPPGRPAAALETTEATASTAAPTSSAATSAPSAPTAASALPSASPSPPSTPAVRTPPRPRAVATTPGF